MSEPKSPEPEADAERLLDEALEESFPASDPISPGAGTGEPIDNHDHKPGKHTKPS